MELNAILNINSFNTLSMITDEQIVNQILECNKETIKYNLTLSPEEAKALTQVRNNALKETKRVEFSSSIMSKLILAFSKSPFISKDNYLDTLEEILSLFYEVKNNTSDLLSDDELITFLKEAYDIPCKGSISMLSGLTINLSRHINSGNKIDSFNYKEV